MRRILIPIDPSDYTKTAYEFAKRIAIFHHSKVEGIAILDKLSLAESAETLVPLPQGNENRIEKETKLLTEARKQMKIEISGFEDYFTNNNISHSSKIYEGRPDFVIENESQYFDLLITGMRNFFHFETKDVPEKTLTQIISQTSTPILAVPKDYKHINNVLIAYDGSLPSLRAAQRFIYLMRDYDYKITLLIAHEDEKNSTNLLNNLEEYIQNHGNNTIEKVWTKNSIVKTFDKEYLNKTDLVVCGLHSQNILKKFFVGSFARHLILLNKVAIFMAQ